MFECHPHWSIELKYAVSSVNIGTLLEDAVLLSSEGGPEVRAEQPPLLLLLLLRLLPPLCHLHSSASWLSCHTAAS